ncbi:hypothetical protein CMUS01_06028 [Colletotrichum musicola]|uniref:Uncharacterized protein n=1 Tax=Colletotrichum musicola TaxID=2175873 RepID=A0A8H6NIF1_9PEZI|nr:hypothetical protein CMUS01_06028 [Colletotrichum musicola]
MSSSPPDKEKSREEKILEQAAAKLKEAQDESFAAERARQRSDEVNDPEEKQKMLHEAAQHEKKAQALSRDAKRLQSGIWQGGMGGAGMGAGLGAGLGAGVGTVVSAVVGGVAVIPTTAVGALVGVAAGAIHGPWYSLKDWAKEKGADGDATVKEPGEQPEPEQADGSEMKK